MMKFLSSLLLLAWAGPAFAKTLSIGSGSGIIRVVGMKGLSEGDVLAIVPGTYSGAVFSDLHGITIVNTGTVAFIGPVELRNDDGLLVTGVETPIYFSGKAGFQFKSPCRHVYFYHFECDGVARLFDTSENQVYQYYNGDPSSILVRFMAAANIVFHNSGSLLFGSQQQNGKTVTTVRNVIDSIAIFNITADSSLNGMRLVNSANIYRVDIHHNRINPQPVVMKGRDIAVFELYGSNGSVHDNYRVGGWGQIARFHGASLASDGVGDCNVYNNLDLSSIAYPSFEIKCDPNEFQFTGGLITGANIHVLNNTAGNKLDFYGTYLSNVCVLSMLAEGFTAEIKNNLTFNCQSPGERDGIRTWVKPSPNISRSNNFYFGDASAAGITDSTYISNTGLGVQRN